MLLPVKRETFSGCRRSGTAYIAASLTEDAFYFTGVVNNDGSNLYRLHWDGGEATVELLPCKQNCEFSARDVSVSLLMAIILRITRRAHRFL